MPTTTLKKMSAQNANPVQYFLYHQNGESNLNQLLGQQFHIAHTGNIFCLACGSKIKKTFAQGYCYPCFIKIPQTEECVLQPHLCRAHEGYARDMDFAREHCLIDHYVYLSLTDSIKIGVTRHTQIPTRWIDQGACYAIKLAKTPNRYLAGLIEHSLKSTMNDRTNWRQMLAGKAKKVYDLVEEKGKIEEMLSFDLREYIDIDDTIFEIEYPVLQYPEKIKSIDLDKKKEFTGILVGIKGQYLIFEDGHVINIRKYGGYEVEF